MKKGETAPATGAEIKEVIDSKFASTANKGLALSGNDFDEVDHYPPKDIQTEARVRAAFRFLLGRRQ